MEDADDSELCLGSAIENQIFHEAWNGETADAKQSGIVGFPDSPDPRRFGELYEYIAGGIVKSQCGFGIALSEILKLVLDIQPGRRLNDNPKGRYLRRFRMYLSISLARSASTYSGVTSIAGPLLSPSSKSSSR